MRLFPWLFASGQSQSWNKVQRLWPANGAASISGAAGVGREVQLVCHDLPVASRVCEAGDRVTVELVGQDLGRGQHTVGERCCWGWAYLLRAGTHNVGVSLMRHSANLYRSITGVK